MSWLRQSPSANSLQDSKGASGGHSSSISAAGNKHLQPPVTRFLACGTLYITTVLSVPPSLVDPLHAPGLDSQSRLPTTTSVRAKQVIAERGGSAVNILAILAQFNTFSPHGSSASASPSNNNASAARRSVVECALVAPLGSDATGRALMQELELEGVRTRFCKVHPAGVPAAFVLQSDDSPCRTIINHNPLPELSHEDFISILGPILVPEHYQGLGSHHWHPHPSLPQAPPVHAVYGPGPGLPPITTPPFNNAFSPINPIPVTSSQQPLPPSTPGLPFNAPFSIFHVTGRSQNADAITLMNLTGVDGLARDRSWRDKAAFSLDCTAPVVNEEAKTARQKLFPHVDVIFFSKSYAQSINPSTPAQKLTPRSFLLSQVPFVAPHALLLVHWDHDGGALLSVPTREYLQSSVWTDIDAPKEPTPVPSVNQQPATSPPVDVRPETQLSLGSFDPRYDEFGTLKSNPHAEAPSGSKPKRTSKGASYRLSQGDGTNKPNHRHVLSEGATVETSHTTSTGPVHANAPEGGTFDYGFAEAFANVTPNSSWDYRANRTAVIYDSGDDSDSDYGQPVGGKKSGKGPHGLGLQTDMLRMGTGPSGIIISEGIALSPSDVDSDIDVNIAAVASRFVMEERIRRVYGPMEGDPVDSDVLDYESVESAEQGNDSDATESGQQLAGPTRVGKLKKEKMRLKEEEMAEEVRRQIEEEEIMNREMHEEEQEKVETFSIRSEAPPPKPKPPLPLGVVEAWQAGLLYALTRNVLPGAPYCPTIASRPQTDSKGKEGSSKLKKPENISPSDWAWKWRLDECLRFAAELAGRRARKGTMEGLAREMEENGWF